MLGALPKRSWRKRLRRLGLAGLVPLWRHVETQSPATQSRWQWTWAIDASVFHKYGQQLGIVGRWWSGQPHRVLSGIDGFLRVVVIGDGKQVVPVDFVMRRPDPTRAWCPLSGQTELGADDARCALGSLPAPRPGVAPSA